MAVIDLHTHSTCSDGTDLPGNIPALAALAGCSHVSLTDHDTLEGIREARLAADVAGITLIPGCEVSCAFKDRSVHVLVYFVEPGEGPFQDELVSLQADRISRNKALAARFVELKIPISYTDMVAEAMSEKSVGRPHVAAILVRLGLATSIPDAFDRWLGEGKPAYFPKARLSPKEVANLAKESGGVAVLAHPLTLRMERNELTSAIGELARNGLCGIEVFYGSYSPDERRGLFSIAKRHKLVATGGSDYHGTVKPGLLVGTGRGDLHVPDSVIEQLASKRPDS